MAAGTSSSRLWVSVAGTSPYWRGSEKMVLLTDVTRAIRLRHSQEDPIELPTAGQALCTEHSPRSTDICRTQGRSPLETRSALVVATKTGLFAISHAGELAAKQRNAISHKIVRFQISREPRKSQHSLQTMGQAGV